VLTSLVAPVLVYEISAPQDTLNIKETLEVSSCRIFSWGISSQHNLQPWNTGIDLDSFLHYDTMKSGSCVSGLEQNIFPPLFQYK
jgi:hypothetical protein